MRIYTDMVGDLFHYGHVAFLKQVSDLAKDGTVIVGVHNDQVVENYKRIPIMNMKERISVVKSCKYVDEVIENAPVHITKDYLDKHNIDKVVTVDNRTPEQLEMMYSVPLELGILNYVKYTDTISTTDIINRIKNRIL